MTPRRSRFGKDKDAADAPKRLAGNCRPWRDLLAMSVAQRLAVETAPLDVQAYSGDWRTLEEAITRSSKTLLTGMTSKCAAHSQGEEVVEILVRMVATSFIAWAPVASKESHGMLHRMIIGLVTAAAVAAGLTGNAFAFSGGVSHVVATLSL
jgi:hypothetical protein